MQKQRMMLKAEAILRYFLGTSDKVETLVMCKPNNVDLVCYDQSLYEAIGSLNPEEKQDALRKLTKFLESVEVVSFREKTNNERIILKQERVDELRSAGGKNGTEKD
ncbi:hypothetical protein KY328_04025 [Candidatus Woesearchaeota archaeon]|nr:hypothetical protein [Candidatus Woesearchaeota archaeon]MBW3022065.1 hypothetical protein [Candidatus Woesearchaeota archaeon]